MNTHSVRMLSYVTQMNKLADSVETTSLFAGFDITDIICLIIFSIYAFQSVRFSIEAFSSANKEYNANRTGKNYNLYNLIFAESEFTLKSDQQITRFSSILITMISILLLSLLFMPPADEML